MTISPVRPPVGIKFDEKMLGYFSTKILDDYKLAEEQGRKDRSKFELRLTVVYDDLEAITTGKKSTLNLSGKMTAPALSAQTLATEGTAEMLVPDPSKVETRVVWYRLKLASPEGKHYFLEGFKELHDDPGFDLWSDWTILYIALYEGDDAKGKVLGKGILKIRPQDFARQMTTMRVTNATGIKQRLAATATFNRWFLGQLFETYGGIVSRPTRFDPDAPPRKKRRLRIRRAPEVHSFKALDGVPLRLTRYLGGNKGPVILSHGFGVSSKIFSIDTIDTNLLEYLYGREFDVWLLDHRASIDLPASTSQFNGDDVATKDYPAAVQTVRELSGADSVQVVAHCFGSTTFFMAMLAGLQGVRSAVASQIATHVKTATMLRLEAGLHTPSILDRLGVGSLTAYADRREDWLDRLYDRALNVFPVQREEGCRSAVCHRIAFMYSQLFEHDQLNEATHRALHEMFGIANLTAFEHLAVMVRKGHLVTAQGEDAYLPNLQRLAIPIAFIHGQENACFKPESTEITYDLLRATNEPELYSRHVIPRYGHIDCIFGKRAAEDVYPLILGHLQGPGA